MEAQFILFEFSNIIRRDLIWTRLNNRYLLEVHSQDSSFTTTFKYFI